MLTKEPLSTLSPGHGDIHKPKAFDHAIIGNALKKKHLAFSQWTGRAQPDYWFYSAVNFKKMVDTLMGLPDAGGLRVYFGLCTSAVAALQPYENTLILIYTATDGALKDLYHKDPSTPYFVITPPDWGNGVKFTDGQLISLTKAQASPLVAAYQIRLQPFSKALHETILQKYGQPAQPLFGETNSLCWTKEWAGNVYEAMDNYTACGISMFLGAYSEDCDPAQDKRTLGQLTLVLEYVSSFNYQGKTYYFHFDLDDMPDVKKNGRRTKSIQVMMGGDLANPCPPNTCDGSSQP
jgi:hypothetical protein